MSRFSPLPSPVYNPKGLTGPQRSTTYAADAFLMSHGFDRRTGAPRTRAARTRGPRKAKTFKGDEHSLTLAVFPGDTHGVPTRTRIPARKAS